MPFDPKEFLNVARDVARRRTEGSLRTAVGRAYFAVAITAWLRLTPRPRQRRKLDHKEIGRAANRAGTAFGNQFKALLRLRAEADYYMEPSEAGYADWEFNWQLAESLSKTLIERVDRFAR